MMVCTVVGKVLYTVLEIVMDTDRVLDDVSFTQIYGTGYSHGYSILHCAVYTAGQGVRDGAG